MTRFSGRVHSIVFDNSAQGFYILRMILDSTTAIEDMTLDAGLPSKSVTVRGNITGLHVEVGSWFGFEGEWVQHEKFGRQIAITRAPLVDVWTTDVVSSVLVANGVGEGVVNRMGDHFGDALTDTLDRFDAGLLLAVPGFTEIVATHVLDRWRFVKAYFKSLDFMAEAGVPRHKVAAVWSVFGDQAEEVLSTNPWALVQIDGITFQQADEVARKLGLSNDSPHRIGGAIRFSLKTQKGMGHMYMTTGDIALGVSTLVGEITPENIAHGVAALHKAGGVVVDKATRPGTTALYEPWLYKVESVAPKLLLQRMRGAKLDTDSDYGLNLSKTGPTAEAFWVENPGNIQGVVRAALEDWSTSTKVHLSEHQIEGAIYALTEPVSIVTGLPGTGKTTLLRAVVQLLRDAEISFLLIAPTGIAAKRIASVTGAPAATIHRALGAKGFSRDKGRASTYVGITGTGDLSGDSSDGSGELWECTESPYPAQVVICDESSMVDQHLFYRILTCTQPNARLVFIGDAAQLPSVGPGNVLRDLVSTNLFPTVALRDIFRQEDTSQIVVAAHAINRGETPEVSPSMRDDFSLVHQKSDVDAADLIVKIAASLYQKRKAFQVMSPRHGGVLGVTSLNSRLRELLNPQQPGLAEMRMGSETIREDDRVMVVKNNYDLEIFNGDTGKISRIDRKAKLLTVKLHGPPVQYVDIPFKDAAEHLRLAYAVTVHKMQGQEADNVVLPLVSSFGFQLQRNLLYTAITRAKKRVIMVGERAALVKAIENNRPDDRNTLFADRLRLTFKDQVQ